MGIHCSALPASHPNDKEGFVFLRFVPAGMRSTASLGRDSIKNVIGSSKKGPKTNSLHFSILAKILLLKSMGKLFPHPVGVFCTIPNLLKSHIIQKIDFVRRAAISSNITYSPYSLCSAYSNSSAPGGEASVAHHGRGGNCRHVWGIMEAIVGEVSWRKG